MGVGTGVVVGALVVGALAVGALVVGALVRMLLGAAVGAGVAVGLDVVDGVLDTVAGGIGMSVGWAGRLIAVPPGLICCTDLSAESPASTGWGMMSSAGYS